MLSKTPGNLDVIRWLPVKNVSGETAPAFAALQPTGAFTNDGALEVTKSTRDDNNQVLLNGPTEIPDEGAGMATNEYPALAYYDTGDGTPANGEKWGAVAGEWKIQKGYEGFLIIGGADTTNGHVLVMRDPSCPGGFAGTPYYYLYTPPNDLRSNCFPCCPLLPYTWKLNMGSICSPFDVDFLIPAYFLDPGSPCFVWLWECGGSAFSGCQPVDHCLKKDTGLSPPPAAGITFSNYHVILRRIMITLSDMGDGTCRMNLGIVWGLYYQYNQTFPVSQSCDGNNWQYTSVNYVGSYSTFPNSFNGANCFGPHTLTGSIAVYDPFGTWFVPWTDFCATSGGMTVSLP